MYVYNRSCVPCLQCAAVSVLLSGGPSQCSGYEIAEPTHTHAHTVYNVYNSVYNVYNSVYNSVYNIYIYICTYKDE